MANVVWPSSFFAFEKPLVSDYNERLGSTSVRSSMDVGPDKVRQRTTAAVDEIDMMYLLTESELNDLYSFYRNTAKNGSLRFNATHPRTGTTEEFRFREPPAESATGNGLFRAQVKVEVLP